MSANEKHVALANEILLVDPKHFFALRDEIDGTKFISWVNEIRQKMSAALQQVESEKEAELLKQFQDAEKKAYERGKSEALAAKVVGPSDEEMEKFIADNGPEKRGPITEFVDTGFRAGAQWFRSQLTLTNASETSAAPNEPEVKAQEWANKKAREIVKKFEKSVFIEDIPDNNPTSLNLQRYLADALLEARGEVEVKAQGFEEWYATYDVMSNHDKDIAMDAWQAALSGANAACGGFESWFVDVASQKAKDIVNRIENIANRPDLRETQLTQVREILELVMLAGQKSKAATLKLPENKTGSNSVSQDMETFAEYHYNKGYNAALDAVKSMNEGDGE